MREIPVGTTVWKKACLPGVVAQTRVDGRYSRLSGEYALVEMEVVEAGFVADVEFSNDPVCWQTNSHKQKGRVRAARVVGITDWEGNKIQVALSAHRAFEASLFEYTVGKTVVPEKPFDERNIACGSGIHCFTEKWRAEQYEF